MFIFLLLIMISEDLPPKDRNLSIINKNLFGSIVDKYSHNFQI